MGQKNGLKNIQENQRHFFGSKVFPGLRILSSATECDVLVPGIPGTGIFLFFGCIGTNWYRKKVSELVSVKFGTEKKVSEPVLAKFGTGKSLGTGIGKI